MDIINELGNHVEKLWREKNYNEELFPAIAAEALREFDVPSKLSVWEIASHTLEQIELPQQQDLYARFSDVPITIARFPRFHIDVFYWYDGTTAIHQHSFCGAFQVFEGSSLHSNFEFEVDEKLNFFSEIGKIKLKKVQLLKKGDVSEIADGKKFIHSLFHLDQPSVTLIVRTIRTPLSYPQFSYRKPSLAIDAYFEDPNIVKKIQVAVMLIRMKRSDADEQIGNLLRKSDLMTCYLILSNIRQFLSGNQIEQMFNVSQNSFGKLIGVVQETHGKLAESLPQIFAEEIRLEEIAGRRSLITDAEHRFFIALLMNLDEKEQIFKMINERFPDAKAIEKILDWTFDLSNTKIIGSNIPNALGIENFDDHDSMALEFSLKNLSDAEIKEVLTKDYGLANTDDWLANLPKRREKLGQSIILRPLIG
jgi:hypothetical protein